MPLAIIKLITEIVIYLTLLCNLPASLAGVGTVLVVLREGRERPGRILTLLCYVRVWVLGTTLETFNGTCWKECKYWITAAAAATTTTTTTTNLKKYLGLILKKLIES